MIMYGLEISFIVGGWQDGWMRIIDHEMRLIYEEPAWKMKSYLREHHPAAYERYMHVVYHIQYKKRKELEERINYIPEVIELSRSVDTYKMWDASWEEAREYEEDYF